MTAELSLTFLGTGTSGGVPELACECEVCRSTDERDRRLRTSALIECLDTSVLIDTSVDIRTQLLRSHTSKVDAVFYTHHHADHLLGLDDLRAISFRQNKAIDIFAKDDHMEELERIFPYIFKGPVQKGGGIVKIKPHIIEPNKFTYQDLTITPLPVTHGILDIFGYYINDRLAYITDASEIKKQVIQKIKNIPVLVINALRYRKHTTHFNIEEALHVIREIAPLKCYLIHMTHDISHKKLLKKLPASILPAYDGLKIQI